MKLLALNKAMKKPPRSDEGDGELFCGTNINFATPVGYLHNVTLNTPITGLTVGKRYLIIALTTSDSGGGAGRTLTCSGTKNASYLLPYNYSGTSYFHTYFFADVTATSTTITFSGSAGRLTAWAFLID